METELVNKNCPFCGSNDIGPENIVMTTDFAESTDRVVYCYSCGATAMEAIWNTRNGERDNA